MQYVRRSRFFRSVVLPLTLVAFLLPACQTWRGVNTNVVSPKELPSPVRVTLIDGEEISLEDATVTTDSVLGWHEGAWRAALGEMQPVRIALDDVAKTERKKANPAATVGLVVGAAIGLSVVLLALFPPDLNVSIGRTGM